MFQQSFTLPLSDGFLPLISVVQWLETAESVQPSRVLQDASLS